MCLEKHIFKIENVRKSYKAISVKSGVGNQKQAEAAKWADLLPRV